MKILFATIACFSLCALVAVGGGAKTTKATVAGSCTVTGGSDDGKKIPSGTIDSLMMVVAFKDGKYAVTIKGKEVEKGSYKIGTNKKKQSTIDMKVEEGKDTGKTQIGIFKIDADQLTMAVVIGSKDRPKSFAPAAGVEVRELKRNK